MAMGRIFSKLALRNCGHSWNTVPVNAFAMISLPEGKADRKGRDEAIEEIAE